MKKIAVVILTVLAAAGWARDNTFSVQVQGGWWNGLSGEFGVGLFNVAGQPLGLRLGISYSLSDAVDNSVQAPSAESAQNLTFGLDLSYSFDFQSAFTVSPYLGGRYNLFSGSVTVGSGIATTSQINSNQWGLGAGVRLGYFLDNQASLLLDLGADYFFESAIQLGNATYQPGESTAGPPVIVVHNWVNDPRLVLKARLGVAFNF